MIARAALAALALAAALPAHAAAAPDLAIDLRALRGLDARVQSAGWRLTRGNAAYCDRIVPGIGLLLFDAAGFRDPPAVRAVLGLTHDIAVDAVAAGSPADRAGLGGWNGLRIVAGDPVAALPAVEAGDYKRLVALHDRIDAVLASEGRARFEADDGRSATVAAEPACASRFEVLSRGSRAAADGRRVVIGRDLVEELPDDLLAAALAHELAHNVLGHPAHLDAIGRGWNRIKATEREADRLMPWLLANAGIDPQAAVRFFATWGPRHDPGLFRVPDHDGWKSRAARVSAELAAVAASRAAHGGAADWRADFRRGE